MMIDPTKPFGASISSLAKDPANKTDGPFGQLVSSLAKERNAARSNETDVSLSLNSGSSTLASQELLTKTVLDALNKKLEDSFGPNAIQNAYEQGIDVSPQATADRIVQGATGLFARFSEKYADLSETERLDSFMATIRSGIEQGFKEARDILEGLNVLQGDIASNIDKTYELVQQGLDKFKASFEQTS